MNLTRRRFIAGTSALGLAAALGTSRAAADVFMPKCRVRGVTGGPRHHFFGYYGMPPWNLSGQSMVCLETTFQERMPTADDAAAIGVVDPRSGKFDPVAQTRTWNFQQGCMLHWNPLNPEKEIVYNDREGRDPVAVLLDVTTGKKRLLPGHVSGVARKAPYAVGLSYGRIGQIRKTVGYAGLDPRAAVAPHPDDDGVFLVDLQSGQRKLVVSVGECYRRLAGSHPELQDLPMWLDHTVFNRTDTRFLFLARTFLPSPKRPLASAMFTANLDGTGLREVISFRVAVSHFDWRNDRQILATLNPAPGAPIKHVLFTDGQDDLRVLGAEFFRGDGHCHFSPDEKWIVSDPYNSAIRGRELLLYHLEAQRGMKLGGFALNEYSGNDNRCDLHPRWKRTGDAICFDALAAGDGTRQVHLAELDFSR